MIVWYAVTRISSAGNSLTSSSERSTSSWTIRRRQKRDFDFAKQLRRAVSSGPANISEAFAYYRHKESAKFARVAKGSLTETHNHLGDGIDRGHWTAERCEASRQLADRAIGATTEWLKYLTSSEEP
jgi:four helix bundle protein